MKVRRIDSNGDWTFGQGLANYAKEAEAVRQNVQTRLKSFKYDWFLNVNAGIDWLTILGMKDNETIIKEEIRRVCANTFGVRAVNQVSIDEIDDHRKARIILKYETIYDDVLTDSVEIIL